MRETPTYRIAMAIGQGVVLLLAVLAAANTIATVAEALTR